MLKRILFIAILASVVAFVGTSLEPQAATPNVQMYNFTPSDTGDVFLIVDSQYTGNWEAICTLFVTNSDTAEITLTVTGVALMGQREKLYIGFGNDSANRVDAATAATTGQTNSNLDTIIFETPLYGAGGMASVSFMARFVYYAVAGVLDTFYVNAATGDKSKSIELNDVVFTALVASRDSLN